MKRCLVISDSFKGTLSSPAICRIARGLAVPGWQVDALPVADGGEGTVDCFLDACGGQRVTAVVSDPFDAEAESFSMMEETSAKISSFVSAIRASPLQSVSPFWARM